MSVNTPKRDLIVLEGSCPSDDAEKLLQRLLAAPAATVDLRNCRSLHIAILQVLLAAEPKLLLPPVDSDMGKRLRAELRSVITD